MTVKNTAEQIIAGLNVNGIKSLYCLPGVQNDNFFDNLHHSGMPAAVHTRHEQGAAYMALGAALATGEPQAYCVVPGPGFLNTTAALSTIYALNAPVLALSGQIASAQIGRGKGLLHEIPDQLGIAERLTRWSARINSADDVARLIQQTFQQFRSADPGPVMLECPMDVWNQTSAVGEDQVAAMAENTSLDPDEIDAAAKLLARAKNPMIFVGGGAQHAGDAILELAERLQAPVVAERTGHGIVDARHYLSQSMPAAYELWSKVDVVLAIGSRLMTPRLSWGIDKDLKVIHLVGNERTVAAFPEPDISLICDSDKGTRALLEALSIQAAKQDDAGRDISHPKREEELTALKASLDKQFRETVGPQMAFLDAIRDVLPEDGIFVDELTQVGYVSRYAFPVYQPRSFLSTGYQGTLGWGMPSALGAKHALPDKAVVSISGDGGFMFNVQELATAVRHKIGLSMIVFSDGYYGNVKRMQEEGFEGRTIANDLANPDFVKLAESFGAQGIRANNPNELRAALEVSFANANQPTVIEVPCGEFPSPWPWIFRPPVRGI